MGDIDVSELEIDSAQFSDKIGHPGVLVDQAICWVKGDLVVHGFDDDPPANLLPLVQALVENPAALWATGRTGEVSMDWTANGVTYAGTPGDHLLFRNTVPLQGCLFRRALFETISFVEPESMPWSYDWDLVLRLQVAGIVPVHVDKVVGWWAQNPNGLIQAKRAIAEVDCWQERRSSIWKGKSVA